MEVTKIYTPNETIATPSGADLDLAKKILSQNLSLKPSERLLIVTDPIMEHQEASWWFNAGKQISPHTQVVVFSGMRQNAQEPPSIVSLMMSKSDCVILQTSYSLSHTQARILASKSGARIASLPTAKLNLLIRTLKTDFSRIKDHTESIAALLTQSSKVEITSTNGTNLSLSIDSRTAIADTGFFTKKGDFGNLPAGEAFIAPVEGSAQGVVVFDGSFANIPLDYPITIKVENGLAVSISGKKAATILNRQLSDLTQDARNIGELGIGTNPQANPRGELIEAEKAYGTVHIALGRNDSFGGTVNVPFHSDGVVLKPTVYLDEKAIIRSGEFVQQ